MSDLHQYAALLGEHDDATIAGMAGCSEEDVAAFRASQAPARRSTRKAADKAPVAVEDAAPPPLRTLQDYVADLREDQAHELYAALKARLFPAPADLPAPSAVRAKGRGFATDPAGRKIVLRRRDVFTGEIAAHLWAHHRDAVETIPGHQ